MSDVETVSRQLYESFQAQQLDFVSQEQILDLMQGQPPELIQNVLNHLLRQRLLEPFQQNEKVVFRLVAQKEAAFVSQLHGDEQIVYLAIKAAGNQGIWTRTLKSKTNLHQNVVARCLKSLESKQIVKAVKSVKQPSRRIYMLFELVPAGEITGGVWFTDQELDNEFIETLANGIFMYINKLSQSQPKPRYPTIPQILDWIQKSGLTSEQLNESHISSLVNLLIYDGKIEKRDADGTYKVVMPYFNPTQDQLDSFTGTPCSACPNFDLCASHNPISPENCKYFEKWLNGGSN